MSKKEEYSHSKLIKLYVKRCEELGRALDSREIIDDKKLPAYSTYYRHGICLNDLYKAAGYEEIARKRYTKKELIDDYVKECEKAGKVLDEKEITENDNLASYMPYQSRGLSLKKLRGIIKGNTAIKDSYEYYRNNSEQFCEDCPEKDDCNYQDIKECEYYEEVVNYA